MEDISDIMAKDNISRCVKFYGIEGTEDRIKSAYKVMPKIQSKMLNILYNMYNFGIEGDFDEK